MKPRIVFVGTISGNDIDKYEAHDYWDRRVAAPMFEFEIPDDYFLTQIFHHNTKSNRNRHPGSAASRVVEFFALLEPIKPKNKENENDGK